MCYSGVGVDTSEYQLSIPGSFFASGGYDLLFSVDMVNLSCWWVGGGSNLEEKVLFRTG